jgi:hypothetical protein
MNKNEFLTNAIRSGMSMDEALVTWKEQSSTKNDLAALVAVFRNTTGTKAEIIEKASGASGYSLATAGHFYNALAFAKEYHKQESAN